MENSVTPIFIYSMPRSGSTLLQRILGSHGDIATVSEPWILLPLISTYADSTIYDGDILHCQLAISEFISQMPNGIEDYRARMRSFVTGLYSSVSGGSPYFLDKTPGYSRIAPQIVELFPSAKHIVLWRNPLAILSSMVSTFQSNAWVLESYELELYTGMENLFKISELPNVHTIKYEDILASPQESLEGLFNYLGLEFSEEIISSFSDLKLSGSMGDPTGIHHYRSLAKEPLDKWKQVLANPYRRYWAKRYLEWLGRDRLAYMGYSLDDLLNQFKETANQPTTLLTDSTGNLYRKCRRLASRNFDYPTRQKLKKLLHRFGV